MFLYLSKDNPKKGHAIGTSFQFEPIHFEEVSYPVKDCPDIPIPLSAAETLNLRDFLGNVIVLRFSRFNKHDLEGLHFLDSLFTRLQKYNFRLVFINTLGKDNSIRQEHFSAPVVDDDGYIASIFHANLNDLILIDKSFKIRIKHNNLNNPTIYSLITTHLFDEGQKMPAFSDSSLEIILKQSFYMNVRTQHIECIRQTIRERPSIIHLFLSVCLSCLPQIRVSLMNGYGFPETSQETPLIMILFSSRNEISEVNNFIERYDIPQKVTVGIFSDTDKDSMFEESLLYKYYIDPYFIILNSRGRITFSEEPGDIVRLDASTMARYFK
ncbi:MAG: hypothetical protein SCM96_09245 [Acidobacteriota bacterium]|nr:hypothetical protein [Acidobacteriota bacterium]